MSSNKFQLQFGNYQITDGPGRWRLARAIIDGDLVEFSFFISEDFSVKREVRIVGIEALNTERTKWMINKGWVERTDRKGNRVYVSCTGEYDIKTRKGNFLVKRKKINLEIDNS